MRRYLISWLAAIALLACVNAYAHHSFAATYVENGSVTNEGDLVTFEVRNPHSFVNVMVKDASGAMARHLGDWGLPSQLQGKISRDTPKSGYHLIITRNPAPKPD